MPLQGASGGPDNILASGGSPRAEYGFVDIDGVDDEFLAMQREMQQLKAEEVLLKRVTQKGTLWRQLELIVLALRSKSDRIWASWMCKSHWI